MNIKHRFAPAIACFLLAGLLAQPVEAQFAKLLERVPSSSNTVILLNAEKVLNSEIALREGWKTNFEKSIAAGLTYLPADTQQFVMASQTDFRHMYPVWQVGVMSTKERHDMVYIASKKKGTLDTVAGLPAVLLPSENYLIQFDQSTYATLVPGSRQAVSRWVKSTSEETPSFSPYIAEAISYAEEAGTEVIMAMDLTDFLKLDEVREEVNKSKPILSAGVDREAASKVLASVRGVMLGITFGSKPFGSIKVDFGEDARVLKGIAPQLLGDILAEQGAMIDDFAKWTGKVDGKQLRVSGDLSADGMRKVFSLIDVPTASSVTPGFAKNDTQSTNDQDPVITATQTYFVSVNQFVRDLRNKEPQRIAQYGIWFDKYARKIDQLPMVNVDGEMLDFGAYVAQQFRNAGAAIQGIGVRSRVRQVSNVNAAGAPGYWGGAFDGGFYHGGFYWRGGAWGGRGQIGNFQQAELRQQQRIRTQVKVEEKAMGTSAARAIMKEIDSAFATMRRQMTEKYNVEFNLR